jgi:chromosome segregation ATPase
MNFFLLLLVGVVFFAACKKSVEGENKQWDYAVKELNDLKITYKSFSPAIDALVKKAESVKKEADGMGDEKQKIAKLSEANNLLSHEFVRDLKSFKDKKKQLNDDILKLETSPKDESFKQSAMTVVSEARMLLRSIDDQLAANAASIDDATSLTRKVTGNFKQAQDNVSNLLAQISKKAAENAPATGNTNGNTGTAPADNNAQAAQVKCKYCSGMNDAAAAKCKSCGAPIKK